MYSDYQFHTFEEYIRIPRAVVGRINLYQLFYEFYFPLALFYIVHQLHILALDQFSYIYDQLFSSPAISLVQYIILLNILRKWLIQSYFFASKQRYCDYRTHCVLLFSSLQSLQTTIYYFFKKSKLNRYNGGGGSESRDKIEQSELWICKSLANYVF